MMGVANKGLTGFAHTIDCPVEKRKWTRPLNNRKKLHNYMFSWGNFETWQSRTAECRKSGQHQRLFFSAGTPLSSEVALLDAL